jgi:predicted RNA binding protein YcfA (HicA-like mRNA interferase family)
MPRLPRVSGTDAVQALRRAGFVVFDQEGSHLYLHRRVGDRFTHRVTVPVHGKKILKPKTLKSILKAAGLTVTRFIDLLHG